MMEGIHNNIHSATVEQLKKWITTLRQNPSEFSLRGYKYRRDEMKAFILRKIQHGDAYTEGKPVPETRETSEASPDYENLLYTNRCNCHKSRKGHKTSWMMYNPNDEEDFQTYRDRYAYENRRSQSARKRYLPSKTHKRTHIYICMLDDKPDEVFVNTVVSYLRIFFPGVVVITKHVPILYNECEKSSVQYDKDWITTQLSKLRDNSKECPNAYACLGITRQDLTVPDFNYVFGQVSIMHRAGALSSYRFTKNKRINLREMLKLCTHEASHLFDLRHCQEYVCLMNGSNDLKDMRSNTMHLCPTCLRKLQWALVDVHDLKLSSWYKSLCNWFKTNDEEYFRPEIVWIDTKLGMTTTT